MYAAVDESVVEVSFSLLVNSCCMDQFVLRYLCCPFFHLTQEISCIPGNRIGLHIWVTARVKSHCSWKCISREILSNIYKYITLIHIHNINIHCVPVNLKLAIYSDWFGIWMYGLEDSLIINEVPWAHIIHSYWHWILQSLN